MLFIKILHQCKQLHTNQISIIIFNNIVINMLKSKYYKYKIIYKHFTKTLLTK
jgi:hypothetical protein